MFQRLCYEWNEIEKELSCNRAVSIHITTERCVSEDAESRGVDCEIPHRLERETKHLKKTISASGELELFHQYYSCYLREL